jgi:hypothetical protein
MSYTNGPRFPMGRPVITPAAQVTLDTADCERHAADDSRRRTHDFVG